MINVKRYGRGLKRYLFAHQCPHGLVSWRYLLPNAPSQVRYHRHLWWYQVKPIPTIFWLILEAVLWLRWLGWGSWRASFNWLSIRGESYQKETGISRIRQYYLLQKLALSWAIHPRQSYQFGLLAQPEQTLDYIFNQETAAYHTSRNQQRGTRLQHLSYLQNKDELARLFSGTPIHMVETIKVVARQQHTSLWDTLPTPSSYFIKSRRGNQGRGAFKIWQQNQQWQGQTLQGKPLHDQVQISSAWRQLLAEDDVLLQPLLVNHPTLSDLTEIDDVLTFRIISGWQQKKLVFYHQLLEIPYRGPSGIGYVFLTVTESGELHPVAQLAYIPQQQQLNKKITQSLPVLPYYQEIAAQTRQAQQYFPTLHAIAWDWVITPDGPVLLEGNVGWGTALPQQLHGPLLANGFHT